MGRPSRKAANQPAATEAATNRAWRTAWHVPQAGRSRSVCFRLGAVVAGGRAARAAQVPRVRREAGVALSDRASDGGRVAADAAEYGVAGGDRSGATAPADLRLFVTPRHAARRPTACGDGCFSGRLTSGAPGALPPRETSPTLPPLCHTRDRSPRCFPPRGRAPHSGHRAPRSRER